MISEQWVGRCFLISQCTLKRVCIEAHKLKENTNHIQCTFYLGINSSFDIYALCTPLNRFWLNDHSVGLHPYYLRGMPVADQVIKSVRFAVFSRNRHVFF